MTDDERKSMDVLKLTAQILAVHVCPNDPQLALNAAKSEASSRLDELHEPLCMLHLVER
jgi:hypothetical protein